MSVETHKYYGRPDSNDCTSIILDCIRRPNSFLMFIHVRKDQSELFVEIIKKECTLPFGKSSCQSYSFTPIFIICLVGPMSGFICIYLSALTIMS